MSPAQRPPKYIYAIQFGDYVKIGTTVDPASRLRQLPGGVVVPDDLSPDCRKRPLMAIHGGYETERMLHALLDEFRIVGEWFKLPDHIIDALTKQNSDEKRAVLFALGSEWVPMATGIGHTRITNSDAPLKPVEF